MGDQAVGVREHKVKLILRALEDAHLEVDKIQVKQPSGAMLGGNAAGTALLSDMTHATKSLQLWCSYQSKALVKFGQAIEDAMKAIQNADDDSEASARVIQDAVDGVATRFSELTGKDVRPGAPLPTNLPGPFGALGQVVQTIESEAQWNAGVNK